MTLTLTNLTHTYRRAATPALSDVSATLTPGVYGILGPNGSGKTTMMNIITDNLIPSAGQVLWNGTPVRSMGRAYRDILGYLRSGVCSLWLCTKPLGKGFVGSQCRWLVRKFE